MPKGASRSPPLTLYCLAVPEMPTAQKGLQPLSRTGDRLSPDGSRAPNIQATQNIEQSSSAAAVSSCPAGIDELVTASMPCISALDLLNRGHAPRELGKVPGRDEFKAEMEACLNKLSPRAQRIVGLDVMQKLKDVPNSAAAMTRFFSFADVGRLDHSIHAASKVRDVCNHIERNLLEQERAGLRRQPSSLSEREIAVLECATLLHDLGHRLGSHALDRSLAAHPKAPKIDSFGWEHEFHEFHTAQLVAHTRDLREALGDLYPDVMAVLTHADNRKSNGAGDSFEADFGKVAPTAGVRVSLLHELVEKVLDRNSCLELDFRRGGLADWLVEENKALVDKMESALTLYSGEAGDDLRVRVNKGQLSEDALGWISGRDLADYVSCRQVYREVVAASPASCSVDAFLREAVFKGLERHGYSLQNLNQESFEFLRNGILGGQYEKLLGVDVVQMLTRAPHDASLRAIEDVVAPLATMTKDDFSEYGKLVAVDKSDAKRVCGVERADMTGFELELREYLLDIKNQATKKARYAADDITRRRLWAEAQAAAVDVTVIVTTDIEKIIPYLTLEPDPKGKVPLKPGQAMDVLAVQSSYRAVKVVVAARAIDKEGRPVALGETQRLVEQFCRSRGYLKDGCVDRFDRHVFAKPFLPEPFAKKIEVVRAAAGNDLPGRFVEEMISSSPSLVLFAPEIQARMRDCELKWEKMGQHRLRESDV